MISPSISLASFPEPANEATISSCRGMLPSLRETKSPTNCTKNHDTTLKKVHQKVFVADTKIAFMYYQFDIGLEQHKFRVPAVACVQ